MGSSVSPIVVNFYMEAFEQSVLKDYPDKAPKLWLRFVDDTFVVLDKSKVDPFFKFINSVDPNIKFTQEECCDNKLAFLACLVHRKSNGSLSSTVYRKPTHTDHYLQFNSHHPLVHKLGVIRTLKCRADTIVSEAAAIDEEKYHIQKNFEHLRLP